MKKLLLLSLLVASNAQAINIQNFQFSLDPKYTITEGAFVVDERVADYKLLFNASYNYTNDPLVATDQDKTTRTNVLVRRFNTLDLGASYKIGTNLAVGFQTFATELNGSAVEGTQRVLGDTTISFKTLLTNRNGRTQFALVPKLKLPTGNKDKFTSDGSVGGGVTGVLERDFGLFTISGNLGYMYNKDATYETLNYRKMMLGSLGVTVPLPFKTSVTGEIFGGRTLNNSDGSAPGEMIVSARHQYNKQVGFWGGMSVGNMDSWNSNDFRTFVGLRWTPEVKREPVLNFEQKKYGKLFINDNVYFDHDKASISKEAKAILKKIAASIKDKQNGVTKIVIEGHTSKAGENDYNTKLSKNRAAEVKKFLIQNDISPELLDIVGYGETRILDRKKSAANRRVEFRIYQKNQNQ